VASAARKIVLTGGPGAGKTVITRALIEQFPDRYVLVPEAATAVYSRLNTRWDKLDLAGRRHVQRLKTLLLDRGTIDGAAYWPDGADAYWIDLQTTLSAELRRYDTVLWLETAAALGIYDGDASNAVRFEDAAGAVASGHQLLRLWQDHPRLHHVGAFVDLADKIAAVVELMQR